LDQVYSTEDGGESWLLSENSSFEDIKNLSSNDQQLWGGELPQGIIYLDSYDNYFGWAVLQEGTCTGYKPGAGEQFPAGEKPLLCKSSSTLSRTTDGGISWDEISLPD
jgi:hypothetical protein